MTKKDLFLQCLRETEINVESFTAIKITDYEVVKKFLTLIRKNNIKLGMDMSSLTCSGDVEIICTETKHICLKENDNNSLDYFKFKGLVILIPDITDPEAAPEMFFEADEDIEWLQEYKQYSYPYTQDGRFLGLKIEDNLKAVYDKESIEKYLDMEDDSFYDSDIMVPKMIKITRNTNREMIAYVNVQGDYKRHLGDSIIYKAPNATCDEILNMFSKHYKIV